jgi:hypothetical protein
MPRPPNPSGRRLFAFAQGVATLRWRDRLAALLLGLAAAAIVLSASRSQGVTRDEAVYMRAGELYVTYLEEAALKVLRGDARTAFSDPFIEKYWAFNSEHPPLVKVLGGISWRLFHRCHCPEQAGLHPAQVAPRRHPTLGIFDEITAFRFPAALLCGLLVTFAYLFGLRIAGGVAAFVAAGLTLLSPPFFFHAQLLCFDAPVATFWVGATYFYWRSLFVPARGKWAALLMGLGFATKFNLGFIPVALVPHWLYLYYRMRRRPPMTAFLWAVVLVPAILLVTWPHLWHDAWARFETYKRFHLEHYHYNLEFLGRNYNDPPYPPYFSAVSFLLTAPLCALGLAGIGLSATPPESRGAPRLLLALGVLVPLSVLLLPGAPIFGGVKHFLASYPILAVAAGAGAALIADALRSSLPSSAAATIVGVLAIAPAALETQRSHPYGLSFYNELAGGFRGGADLGMNRQFWGGSVRALLPYFNSLPDGTKIYFHDVHPDALAMYYRTGLLKRTILDAGFEEPAIRRADYAIVIHEKHFNKYEYMIWEAFGTARPVRVLAVEGVPLVTVYQRR